MVLYRTPSGHPEAVSAKSLTLSYLLPFLAQRASGLIGFVYNNRNSIRLEGMREW